MAARVSGAAAGVKLRANPGAWGVVSDEVPGLASPLPLVRNEILLLNRLTRGSYAAGFLARKLT
jgi:hypothetical protein